MTLPSSSFSSSVTQGQSNSSTAAVQAATLASASSATPAIAPPTCMEESAELFEHSVGQSLLEDAQHLLGSQEHKKSEVEAIGSHVPAAAAYCQVGSGDEEDREEEEEEDDDVSDRTWVPGRNEESEEESEWQPREWQSSHHSQLSVPQLFQRKRKYTPSHPHAQRLNASLSKLLALQLLLFQLVESAAFREFAQCAVPQWQVPSRHFFFRKALPALHRHVEGNVLTSLDHTVCSKAHLTTDSWSSKFGQGRYLSFTGHWVTLLAAGKGAGHGSPLELVLPPRVGTAGGHGAAATSSYTLSSTYTYSSLPSSSESFSETPVLSKKSRGYAGAQAKRCHAVLQLVCIGERSQTGAEILTALHGQAQKWFSPRQLEPGSL